MKQTKNALQTSAKKNEEEDAKEAAEFYEKQAEEDHKSATVEISGNIGIEKHTTVEKHTERTEQVKYEVEVVKQSENPEGEFTVGQTKENDGPKESDDNKKENN